MAWVKALERLAKRILALLVAAFTWRPGRRARATRALAGARRVLLVRIDDRVGEALLTTPLLESLARAERPLEVHVLVHQRALRVLAGHPAAAEVIGFDRRRLWMGPLAPGIRPLRRAAYDVVVDCGNWSVPSVTSAIVSRLVASRGACIGPDVFPVGLLRTHPVAPIAGTDSEVAQRLHLLSPMGVPPVHRLSYRAPAPAPGIAAFLGEVRAAPHAVVNPGGRLGWRRIPPAIFAAAARALVSAGRTPVVTWGPGEAELAEEVVRAAPGSRLAPPTSIDDLAALMAAAGLTVCNNTGPMHLSVAVGAPTLQLFLRMEPSRWGHPQPPHRILDLGDRLEPEAEARVAGEVLEFARTLGATPGAAL